MARCIYTTEFLDILAGAGVQSVKLPRSLNLNAYAERFVRTVKENCVEQMILVRSRCGTGSENSLRIITEKEIIKAWKIGLSLRSNASLPKQELSDDDNGSTNPPKSRPRQSSASR